MKTLAFFRSINFGAMKPWRQRATKMAVPSFHEKEEQLSGDLGVILPVTAKRTGSESTFHLLASNLTPQRILFRTSSPLKQGDPLEIEILLQGVGNITIMAQVQFVTLASMTRVPSGQLHRDNPLTPMYSGQLELWTTDKQQEEIRNFLRRNTSKARSMADL